uniref:Uncharacterized protein n=1 Tax=Steinernema glaseri TaxID=37863 RepID=A0A1I8A8U9_9BILA
MVYGFGSVIQSFNSYCQRKSSTLRQSFSANSPKVQDRPSRTRRPARRRLPPPLTTLSTCPCSRRATTTTPPRRKVCWLRLRPPTTILIPSLLTNATLEE